MFRFRQRLVFGQRHLRAEQEIREGPLVQHAVHDHRAVLHLEVKPIVLRPEPVKHGAVAVDPAEPLAGEIGQVLLADLELVDQFELLERIQGGEFRGADFVENNLKHPATLAMGGRFASAKCGR